MNAPDDHRPRTSSTPMTSPPVLHRSLASLALIVALSALSAAASPTTASAQEAAAQEASAQEAAVPRRASATMGDLREVLAGLAEEPDVREVLAAAIDFHDVSHDTFESYQTRASWKSVLPKVSGEYRRSSIDIDVDGFDFVSYGDQLATANLISGGTYDWKVAATWDLPKLVYNPEVLDTYSILEAREVLVAEIVRLFYLRRRALIDLLLEPPTDARTYIGKQLYVEELTARLDAMTGGIYARHGRAAD